jgi:hypothetical protein
MPLKKIIPVAQKSVQILHETKNKVLETITALATTAFGLVAALAWNDAIQTIFKTYLGEQQGLLAKLWYAVLVTFIVVLITFWLGKLASTKKK